MREREREREREGREREGREREEREEERGMVQLLQQRTVTRKFIFKTI